MGRVVVGHRALIARLVAPMPAASLAALRVAFGVVMFVALARFAANGWIDAVYVEPRFHFGYWGLEHLPRAPAPALYAAFALLVLLSLSIALGLFTRASALLFALVFTYVELLEASTYLNHYYAISIFAVLLAITPSGAAWSLDARRGGGSRTVPAWAVYAMRAQVAVVYVFAGVAKLQPDWLVRAEPLHTWLGARTDLPLVGPLLGSFGVALAMSWGGALFDLTIPLWLSWPRTRAVAYGAVVAFHLVTGALFQIGMFPYVMIALTPIFFAPDWPLRFVRAPLPPAERAFSRAPLAILAAHFALQLALPLRHFAIAGDVMRTEEGGRFAWRVMVSERGGYAELRAIDEAGRASVVDLRALLTPAQERAMAAQPDLLPQVARRVRDDYAARGVAVRVVADAWVSVNGREAVRIVDPDADLASVEVPLGHADWVLLE